MERSQWRALFPPRILRRGEAYYDSGAVRSLRQEGGQVLAQVQGQEGYQVEVRFCRGLVEDWACSCPYGREGDPCKHLAAVFLAYNHTALPFCAIALIASLLGNGAGALGRRKNRPGKEAL